jgi:hypothetical protein
MPLGMPLLLSLPHPPPAPPIVRLAFMAVVMLMAVYSRRSRH